MPDAKKKQHYVPQFYLRKFADKFGGLFVFDKASKKTFKSNVRDVGNEKYFYNLPEELRKSLHIRNAQGEEVEVDPELLKQVWEDLDIDPEALKEVGPEIIEEILAEIETEFREALDDLLYTIDKTESFEPEHKLLLAPYLALQFVRTLEYRRNLADMWETMLGDLLGEMHIIMGSPQTPDFPCLLMSKSFHCIMLGICSIQIREQDFPVPYITIFGQCKSIGPSSLFSRPTRQW